MLRMRAFRELIPTSKRDKFQLAFLTIGVPFSVIWMLRILLPEYCSSIPIKHIVFMTILLYSVVGNILMAMRVDPSGDKTQLPTILKKGWYYCHYCEVNSPPRSYHCPHCKACILRRDHHCSFIGCCIGLHNQRYFTVAIVYGFIALTYGMCYQFHYTVSQLDVSYYKLPFIMLAPHFALVFGFLNGWQTAVATVNCVAVAAYVLVLYVLVTQTLVIFTGATQYERKHGLNTYNISLMHNVKMTLGERWYLVFLSPFISSKLPSDGLTYATVNTHEENKDL